MGKYFVKNMSMLGTSGSGSNAIKSHSQRKAASSLESIASVTKTLACAEQNLLHFNLCCALPVRKRQIKQWFSAN